MAYITNNFSGVVKQVRLNATTVSNVVTYDVVVEVENPEEILIPGMTAYVNVMIAQQKGVPLVSNAALRYKPTSLAPKEGDEAKNKAKKESKSEGTGVVYILENDKPKAIKVDLGISDGRFTQILPSSALRVGDKVIIGENKDKDGKSSPKQPSRMF